MSWLALRDERVISIALDRRGLGYANGRLDPRGSLELFDETGSLAIRGRLSFPGYELRAAPFPCAVVLLAIDEIRDHRLEAVVFEPARYWFREANERYERTEAAIVRELRDAAL